MEGSDGGAGRGKWMRSQMFSRNVPMAMENTDDFDTAPGHLVKRNIFPDNDMPYAGHYVVSFHAQIREMR